MWPNVKWIFPDIRFKKQSILSSIKLDGTQIPMIFNGTLTGELFKRYITEMQVPTLKKDDIENWFEHDGYINK